MSLATDEPTWGDLLAEAVRAGCAKMHTSFPATVIAYDPTTQKATVQPALRSRIDDTLLDRERPDLAPPPPIANVPVVWPSGGGVASPWSLHGPLAPGDPVTVVVAERSTDEWRTLGAVDNTPLDARRFDLSDAVAYPGGRSLNPSAGPTAPLGTGAVDPVAAVLAGTLVKLGASTAIEPLLLGVTFLASLTTFLTAVALDTVDSPATAAAASQFLVDLGAAPHISTKVFTE
jgi:hypothetical protein